MKKQELLFEIAEELGFKPTIDDDGDILIRHQMKRIYLLVGNEDSKIIAVLLPNMDMAEEGEVPLYLAACNKFNRECNLAKVYLDQQMTYVNVSVEQAYTDEASLKDCISRAIEVLSVSRSFFSRTLQELSN